MIQKKVGAEKDEKKKVCNNFLCINVCVTFYFLYWFLSNTFSDSSYRFPNTLQFCSILKGRMILRCVKKAISYKCPYVAAIVVPYQIHTVVMMTICAN